MDDPILLAAVVCPGCGARVEAHATGCSRCGSPIGPAGHPQSEARQAPGQTTTLRSVADNRAYLLLLLFGAALVLGLPLLWYGRAYGIVGKIVVTLLVILWTAVLLALCWWSLSWSWERLRQLPW